MPRRCNRDLIGKWPLCMITSDEQISSASLLPICTLCTWVFYSTVSPWEFIYAKLRNFTIGHFRVPKTLPFKMRLDAQPFLWKWVLFAWEWKMISISKAVRLPSFWNRGPGELGKGLFENEAWWWNLLGLHFVCSRFMVHFISHYVQKRWTDKSFESYKTFCIIK